MKHNKATWASLAAGTVAALACSTQTYAQSADALLDKLVEKGVLTVKEANALKAETDKDFTKAYQTKSGMPDWVTSFKINGDIRLRADDMIGNNPNYTDQLRFRYRLRVGATATFLDNFEAGFRLTSAQAYGNFGGDPISGNVTMQDNGSKKYVYLDTVYGKWNFLNTPQFSSAITAGKMDNPFMTFGQLTDMVYDPDYTPEGAALTMTYRVSSKHNLKFTGGGFILDDLASSSREPYLLGAQALWEAAWTPQLSTLLGAGIMSLQSEGQLVNDSVPNVNRGNTRKGATGVLAYNFNPLIADAAVTYNLESFPLYKGAFPIKLAGEYMNNPAAPSGADNYAWQAGVTFGKSGKKGLWEMGYRYKWLGANSWYEELVDSDFGAYYQNTVGLNDGAVSTTNPTGRGYGPGTNVRGHVIKAAWSPYNCLTFTTTCFLTELINSYPAGSKSDMMRLQVDATFKF